MTIKQEIVVKPGDITKINITGKTLYFIIFDSLKNPVLNSNSNIFSKMTITSERRNTINDQHLEKSYHISENNGYTVFSMSFEGIKINLEKDFGGCECLISIPRAAKIIFYQTGRAPKSHEL